MAEYIEREAAAKAACDAVWYGGGAPSVTEAINKVPAADVVPVVHAFWIRRPDGPYGQYRLYCSACKEHSGLQKKKDYCPHCGAKMDGGGEP